MTSITSGALPSRIAGLHCIIRMLAAFGLGALMVPAMPPWCLWPFLVSGFSGFYLLLASTTTVRAAFGYGWLFGFGYFLCGLSWIANALLVDGNEYAWFWPVAVAGLPALLALFTASASALVARFGGFNTVAGYFRFAGIFMIFEWLRGHIFTGFPWNLYGYSWAETLPVAQLASIGGIYWLSLLTVLMAALPGFLVLWSRPASFKGAAILLCLFLCGGAWFYGAQRLAHNPTDNRKDVAIRLVQPNISQSEKWTPEKAGENLQKLLALSDERPVNQLFTTVIVWPETAVSDYLLQNTAAAAAIRAVLSGYENSVYLLSGVMRIEKSDDGTRKYFNSLVVFDKDLNRVATYDKSHLVPFGEYIPLQRWVPLQPFVNFSGFEQGAGPRNMELGDLGPFSPLVCYEIIFPGAVTGKGERPGFIVNATNDSWYGDSAGPRQHFAMARFRAIEEGVPVVRAANTGISGIIDPVGRITHAYELMKEGGDNIPLPAAIAKAPLFSTLKDRLFLICTIILLGFSYRKQRGRLQDSL